LSFTIRSIAALSSRRLALVVSDARLHKALDDVIRALGRFTVESPLDAGCSEELAPDVLVVSVAPEDQDALGLIGRQRERVPDSRIVAVSPYNVSQAVFEAGCDAFLHIPFSIQELLAAVGLLELSE
jgi:DNA-binding response OmpR family regulator